jgi:hypothetical protein
MLHSSKGQGWGIKPGRSSCKVNILSTVCATAVFQAYLVSKMIHIFTPSSTSLDKHQCGLAKGCSPGPTLWLALPSLVLGTVWLLAISMEDGRINRSTQQAESIGLGLGSTREQE